MSDNWKSCWNCWRKRRKNRPHQNRYCKVMKTSKIMLMPFFSFSAAGIRAKCHLVSLDLQPLLWAKINGNAMFFAITCFWTPPLWPVMLFRAWRRCHVLPRLALVSFLCALGAVVMFSRAWRWCHVLSRLAPCHVFPRLRQVACRFSVWLVNCLRSISNVSYGYVGKFFVVCLDLQVGLKDLFVLKPTHGVIYNRIHTFFLFSLLLFLFLRFL